VDFWLKFLQIVGGGLATAAAAYIFYTAQRRQGVAAAKDELIKSITADREAWKSRYEAEHLEIMAYRDQVHAKNEESNAKIITLTTENAELKSKTDLSPLMKMMQTFFAEQTEINQQILDGLTELLTPKRKRARARAAKAD
jgi:hypothetical protein